jgi:hypothetical protein
MEFSEIKKYIDEFVEDQATFSIEQCETIRRCFKLVSDDIHKMIDGENIEQNKNAYDEVLNTILMVSSLILNGPIDNSFSKFITSFSELIYNWNENLWKDKVLKHICLYMSRNAELRNTILETVTVIKDMEDRMRDLSSWSPPAYEVSKEYFELLLKENDEK